MNFQNVKKSTIIRTILMILAIVNIVLEKSGIDIIPADEYTITMVVETLIEIAIFVVGFWKNNSYSEKAIKADEFLKQLREEETESEGVE